MAKDTQGIVVQYKKEDSSIQKGIVYYNRQTQEFKDLNKALVTLVTDNFQAVIECGKQKEVLKDVSLLTQMGFCD